MRKILDKLYSIKTDKLLHFIAGIFVSQVVFAILGTFMPVVWCSVLALVMSCIIGALKELIDTKIGVPSMDDFLYTASGGFTGTVLAVLLTI